MNRTLLLSAVLFFSLESTGQNCDAILPYIKDYHNYKNESQFYQDALSLVTGQSDQIYSGSSDSGRDAGLELGYGGNNLGFDYNDDSENQYVDELSDYFQSNGKMSISYESQEWFMKKLNNPDVINAWQNCNKLANNHGSHVECKISRRGKNEILFSVANRGYQPLEISQLIPNKLIGKGETVFEPGLVIGPGQNKIQYFLIENPEEQAGIDITFKYIPDNYYYSISPPTPPKERKPNPLMGKWRLDRCSNYSGGTSSSSVIVVGDEGTSVYSSFESTDCPMQPFLQDVNVDAEFFDYTLQINYSSILGRINFRPSVVSSGARLDKTSVNKFNSQMKKLQYKILSQNLDEDEWEVKTEIAGSLLKSEWLVYDNTLELILEDQTLFFSRTN